MTKIKRLLDHLVNGGQTLESLAERTGMPLPEVRRVIWNLRGAGYIDTAPEVYTLTSRGARRQMHKPKTPPAVVAKKVAQRRERKAKMERPKVDMTSMAIRANEGSPLFNLGRSTQ